MLCGICLKRFEISVNLSNHYAYRAQTKYYGRGIILTKRRKCIVQINRRRMFRQGTKTHESFVFWNHKYLQMEGEWGKVWEMTSFRWTSPSEVTGNTQMCSLQMLHVIVKWSPSFLQTEPLVNSLRIYWEACRRLGFLWLMCCLVWVFGWGIFQVTHPVLIMGISDLLSFLFYRKSQNLPFTPWL